MLRYLNSIFQAEKKTARTKKTLKAEAIITAWENDPASLQDSKLSAPDRVELMLLAAKKGKILLVETMLRLGTNPNAAYSDGTTALHIAITSNNRPLAKTMLAFKAKIDRVDKVGDTPLHKAVVRDMDEWVLWLVENGASLWIRNDGLQSPASLLNSQTKFGDQFWVEIIGLDRYGNVLATMKSPILFVNRVFKVRGGVSMFSSAIKRILDTNTTGILKFLLMWHISLTRAADYRPSESSDLLAFAERVEAIVGEIFNSDSMDMPINVQRLLQPNKTVSRRTNLIKYQVNSFRKYGVLDTCLRLGCKFIFEKQQLSAFIDEIFWTSTSMELGKFDRRLLDVQVPKPRWFPAQQVDLAFRVAHQNLLDNDFTRLTYGVRSCAALRFYSEAISKSCMVLLIAYTSVFEYGANCETIFDGSCTKDESSAEVFLIIFAFSAFLYEVGELMEMNFNIKEYFSDEWNILDFSGLLLVLGWEMNSEGYVSMARIFLASSAIPLSLGLLRYLCADPSLGVMVAITKAMISDIVAFAAVYGLCILGFGIFFASLFPSSLAFKSPTSTILQLFQITLGGYDFNAFEGNETANTLGQLVLAVYLIFTAILLVNLLIARMSNAYTRIDEKAIQEWSFNKTKLVQRNLLLTEKHPFCMLMPPFNFFTAAMYPLQSRYMRKGISFAGSATNLLLVVITCPLRMMALLYSMTPSMRGVLVSLFTYNHTNTLAFLLYLLSNTTVFILLLTLLMASCLVPFMFELIWPGQRLPLPLDMIERVVDRIPKHLLDDDLAVSRP